MTQEAKQRALDDFPTNSGMTQWVISWFEAHKETIRECLSQPEGVTNGWKPIESAPKDGKRFLATDGYDVEKIRWHNGVWIIRRCSDPFFDEEWDENTPTHWMPLPAAPVQEEMYDETKIF